MPPAQPCPRHLLAIPPAHRHKYLNKTDNDMPAGTSKNSKQKAQAPVASEGEGGVDDALNAFLDEYLKVNIKKQRTEATKFAKDLKGSVERAESNAVTTVAKANKELYQTLNAIDPDVEVDVEQTADLVNHVLQDISDVLETSLERYQVDFDRTLVDMDDEVNGDGQQFLKPDTEVLHAIDAALADRPRHLTHHARKIIKKHNAEQIKRAERKEVGANARALIRQFTDWKV
ncbi:hypothetical protein CF326_g396 [Tilletia indica]|nr:hypothetical protein CF326_g396 [Tilletia indica]